MFRGDVCLCVTALWLLSVTVAAPIPSQGEELHSHTRSSDSPQLTTDPSSAVSPGRSPLSAAASAVAAAAAAVAATGPSPEQEADRAAGRTPSVFCRCFPWPNGALKVPPRTDLRVPPPTVPACAPPVVALNQNTTAATQDLSAEAN